MCRASATVSRAAKIHRLHLCFSSRIVSWLAASYVRDEDALAGDASEAAKMAKFTSFLQRWARSGFVRASGSCFHCVGMCE